MAKRNFKERPVQLAIRVSLRSALFGVPSIQDMQRDYGMSRATAYRLHRQVHSALTPSKAATC